MGPINLPPLQLHMPTNCPLAPACRRVHLLHSRQHLPSGGLLTETRPPVGGGSLLRLGRLGSIQLCAHIMPMLMLN